VRFSTLDENEEFTDQKSFDMKRENSVDSYFMPDNESPQKMGDSHIAAEVFTEANKLVDIKPTTFIKIEECKVVMDHLLQHVIDNFNSAPIADRMVVMVRCWI